MLGERDVSMDWSSARVWVREARKTYEHPWRDIRVVDES